MAAKSKRRKARPVSSNFRQKNHFASSWRHFSTRSKLARRRWLMALTAPKRSESSKPRWNRRGPESGSTSTELGVNEMKKIPLSKVFVDDEVREAGLRAMNSGWYILAKECEAFEAELAAYVGTKEVVLCSNWTSGAMMLFHGMGVCPGDEILVPSHTAFPSIEPMIHRGAKPIFIDIDETFCIDVDQLEGAMSARTVGILPVHLYGHP